MDVEHYPFGKIKLFLGDKVEFTYVGRQNSQISKRDLKRLSGWTHGMRYSGEVKERDYRLLVELRNAESNSLECTHCIYNIEKYIADGLVSDVVVKRNKQLQLNFNSEL